MSDEKMKVDIGLEVHSTGEETIQAMERSIQRLARQIKSVNAGMAAAARGISNPGRTSTSGPGATATKSGRDAASLDRQAITSLRQRMTMQSRMASQQARQERQAFADFKARSAFQAKADAADMRAVRDKAQEEARAFRQRMNFTARIGRLAIQEERRAANERARSVADAARQEERRSRDIARSIRENARLESAESRRVDRERSARESARSRGYSSIRQGAGDVREGAGRAVRGAGAVSAVAAAGTGAAVRRGISTRMEVDSAETDLKIFSGQSSAQITAARKGFLDNESIRNGLGISEGLKTYSEVLKAGIGSPEKVVSTIMKGVAGLELNVRETTKLAGLIDRNYGSASDPAKIKSALNAVAVAAREDPTQSNEIVEGVKRGFGALSTGNMTPEQLTALVSGGQSVGIQPGKAGTFVATQAKRMSEGASKFLGKKERKELDYAARELGFGNARSMAQAYAKESYASIMSVNEKLAAMAPDKRAQVADALYGRQWSDEGLQMSQGVEGVKKTYGEITDSKNANFLDDAARQRAQSLQGQWNSTMSIFGRFWDAFGSGFEDILTSINGYFLNINSKFDYDKIKSYVVSFMDGIKDALGVKTWTELLQNMFGGNLGNAGPQIREFARGLTEGVLTIVRAIRSVMTAFTGSNATATDIGKWAGEFIALSAALLVAAPAISVMTGIGVALTGLATVALGAWRILKAAGLVGATGVGSTPKVPTAPGAKVGGLGRLLGLGGAAAGVAGSGLTKGDQDALTRKLGDWAKDLEKPVTPPSTPWIDPPARTAVDELKRAVEENTLIHRQSFESENSVSGLIHKASLSSGSPATGVRSQIEALGGKIQNAALGSVTSPLAGSTATGGFGPGPVQNSVPGSALGSGGGRLSSRGIIGGGGDTSPTPGNGVIAPNMKGQGADNARKSYDFFRSKGLSHEATAGILASMKQESGFNPAARGDGGRAHGLFQHHPDRRAAILKGTGINMSTAGIDDQLKGAWWEMNQGDAGAQRALKRLQTPGISARDAGGAFVHHFERPARDERASRGAMAERFARQFAPAGSGQTASLGAGIPGLGGAGQYDGLRMKGQQAIAGGQSFQGVTDLARQVQASLPGGVKHFSAFNDRYHAGTGSKHASGLAFDTTLLDAAKSSEAADSIRNKIRAAGIRDDAFKVIDEYRKPSARSTGGHIHSQFNTAEAAKKYSDYIALLRQGAGGDVAAKADSIRSSGWKAGLGGNAPVSAPLGQDTPVRGVNTIPLGGGGAAGGAGSGSSVHAPITIQGAGMDHEAIANAVQRKLNEKMNRRTNDLSPSSLSV